LSLSGDLVDQADSLARGSGGAGRPRQADLRRAVSAAYYAVFHTLSSAAAKQLLPAHHATIRRFITHAGLKSACIAFSGSGTPGQRIKPLVPKPTAIKPALREVAQSCRDLYEARQEADYDFHREFDRESCLELVELGRQTLASWEQVNATGAGGARSQTRSFLAAAILLSAGRPD